MITQLPEIQECPFCHQGKLVERKVSTRSCVRFYVRVQCGCDRSENREIWPFWKSADHAELAIDEWNKFTRDYFDEVVTKQILRGRATI